MMLRILSILSLCSYSAYAGTFVDDRGRSFSFSGNPRVAVRAGVGALSLYHFGMQPSQITAVWGLWGIRGTDLDLNNPSAGSVYPDLDPTADEIAFLQQAINLSPSCYTNNRGCTQWDDVQDLIDNKSKIDYILYIDNGVDDNMATAEQDTGIPVVFIDTFYDYHPDCRLSNFTVNEAGQSNCLGRSMIDIAKRIEELAIALGVPTSDEVNADKQAACTAAQTFTTTMASVQQKGIRIMGTIVTVESDQVLIRTFDPIELWTLRTMEELGAPILHAADDSYDITAAQFFKSCTGGVYDDACTSDTLLPVDFFMIDSRSYPLVQEDLFKTLFPDKAILAGQHWYYPRNDGPVSYASIARILTALSTRLGQAQRLKEESFCTAADPKSAAVIKKGGGLEPNSFICYNYDLIQKKYLTCPGGATPPAPTPAAAPTGSPPTMPTGGSNPAPVTTTSASVTWVVTSAAFCTGALLASLLLL